MKSGLQNSAVLMRIGAYDSINAMWLLEAFVY